MSFDPITPVDPSDPGPGKGYHVYPEALRATATKVADAAALLTTLAQHDLQDTLLGEFDLGLPGTLTVLMPGRNGRGTVQEFNAAVAAVRSITATNADRIQRLAGALTTAASYYEAQDEAEYERLKKLEGGSR
ncbi:hypothetical protein ACIA5G_52110 [Amycolatopsis sp. NPDC051758]|uniref:hypothetical protein n=1 Tax=Amycolatopsis sp. NPDC051758 TaxID=3363935 RepID=UPI0037996314